MQRYNIQNVFVNINSGVKSVFSIGSLPRNVSFIQNFLVFFEKGSKFYQN